MGHREHIGEQLGIPVSRWPPEALKLCSMFFR